ncbi:MAG: DNA internalization-related competence protein ComEC/Rec2 [Chloroflexi bacterium]|nr:DNA internalization-related competence protein ComEC/Rec2 [Chloroflexota bacterium]
MSGRIPALPLGAVAFIAGCVSGALIGGPWPLVLLTALAAAAAAALADVAGGARGRTLLVLLAVAALAAAGHARGSEADARPPPPLASLEGMHEISGVVRSDPRLSGTIARLDLRVESVDGAPAEGGLRLTLPAPREPLRAGDRIAATVEVERPGDFDDFDYAAFLRSRGIHAVAAYPQRWTLLERDAEHEIVNALREMRRWALGNIERALPEPEASLAAGMLLGRQRTMPAALEEDLRRTGTTHLLVVSGQNIALLLGTAVGLLSVVVARRQAALIALALLPGYVVLTGAEPPVVRAAIMAVGIAIAAISGRRTPGWIYLVYALALMLALRPLLIRDVAFQLSATATAGVLLIAPPLRDRILARLGVAPGGLAAGFAEGAAVAVGASLAVLPVQAAAFGTLPVLQAPANVVVAPLYEATVLVAAVAALLGWLQPVAWLVEVAGVFAPAAFVAAVEAMAALPLATVELHPSPLVGAAWFALLGGLVWLLGRRATQIALPGQRAHLAAPVALATAAAGLWLAVLVPSDGLASVTVLDVGQGQAILVQDGGAAVLVDAGPADGAVLTALPRALEGRSLDAVLLTHGDSDHASGLAELRRRLRIGVLLGSAETLAAVATDGGATRALDIGDRIRLSERTSIEVLSPPVVTATRAHQSANNRSLVLLVTIGERRILLPADIEAPAEQWLAASGLDLRADALVLPHHGSRTSSSEAFLEAVEPRVAIASVGARNPHGHPHAEVVERYAEALFLRTDEDGDVTLRSDGERLWVRSSR